MTNISDMFPPQKKRDGDTDNKLSFHFYLEGPSRFEIHFQVSKTIVQKLVQQSNERGIQNPQAYLERSIMALLGGKAYLKSQSFRSPIISAMTLTWLEHSTVTLDQILIQSTYPHLLLIYYKPSLERTGNPRWLFTYSQHHSTQPDEIKILVKSQIVNDKCDFPHYFKSAKVLKF
jgi:hypothetical protein